MNFNYTLHFNYSTNMSAEQCIKKRLWLREGNYILLVSK